MTIANPSKGGDAKPWILSPCGSIPEALSGTQRDQTARFPEMQGARCASACGRFCVPGCHKPGCPKKFYASIQSSGRVTTRELAERAAQMPTLTTVDIMAAIESFLTIVPAELAKGNIVELGDFGSFWLWTTSEGVDTAEEVSADLIGSVLPRFNPGKEFKRVLDAIQFNRN